MSETTLIGIIFMILGIAVIIGSLYSQKKHTLRRQAKVIDVIRRDKEEYDEERRRYIRRTYYYPVISYQVDGHEIIDECHSGSQSFMKYRPGKMIEIFCDPENPTSYRIGGTLGGFIGGAIFAIISLVMALS